MGSLSTCSPVSPFCYIYLFSTAESACQSNRGIFSTIAPLLEYLSKLQRLLCGCVKNGLNPSWKEMSREKRSWVKVFCNVSVFLSIVYFGRDSIQSEIQKVKLQICIYWTQGKAKLAREEGFIWFLNLFQDKTWDTFIVVSFRLSQPAVLHRINNNTRQNNF